MAVIQQAEANGRVLQQDAPVFSGDAIVTGPVGQAQVKFRDDTKLVVGPNSRLVIDAFVYAGGSTARKLSINALKGAFRFISGKSRHDAYNITTPTATIGVRGTEIDVNVSKGVVIYSGAAQVCRRGGGGRNCVMIRGGCSLATFEPNRNVKKVNSVVARNQTLLQGFQYAVDQRQLRPEFRANTASCGVLRAALPVAPDNGQAPRVVVVNEPPPPPPVVTPPPDRCDYHPPHHRPPHRPHHHWPDHHRDDLGPRGGDWHPQPGIRPDRFARPRFNRSFRPDRFASNGPNDPLSDPPARRGFRWQGSQGPNATADFGRRPGRFGFFGNNRRNWGAFGGRQGRNGDGGPDNAVGPNGGSGFHSQGVDSNTVGGIGRGGFNGRGGTGGFGGFSATGRSSFGGRGDSGSGGGGSFRGGSSRGGGGGGFGGGGGGSSNGGGGSGGGHGGGSSGSSGSGGGGGHGGGGSGGGGGGGGGGSHGGGGGGGHGSGGGGGDHGGHGGGHRH